MESLCAGRVSGNCFHGECFGGMCVMLSTY